MTGPPGAGKTLLARSMPSILPALALEESLEITRIYSVNEMLPTDSPLVRHRPFRAPHHTISHAGLVGGGRWPRPGEISLALRGVLFLDELLGFDSRALEVMRQPLDNKICSSRSPVFQRLRVNRIGAVSHNIGPGCSSTKARSPWATLSYLKSNTKPCQRI